MLKKIIVLKNIRSILAILFLLYSFDGMSQSKVIADSLLEIYKSNEYIRGDSLELDLYLKLAYHHPDPNQRIYFSDLLIENTVDPENPYWLYKGYLRKGDAYRFKGELDKALNYYFKSIKYAKTNNNLRGIAIVNSAIADTYSTAQDHANCIQYFNKSITSLIELNDSSTLATILYNKAAEYLRIEKFDSAFASFDESRSIFLTLNNSMGIAYNDAAIGAIYIEQNKLDSAKTNIKKAIEIFTNAKNDYSCSLYKGKLADIYIKEKNYTKAIKFAHSSLDLALSANLPSEIRDASERLSRIYNVLGEYEKAFQFQSKYIAYRDTINSEQTIRKMADLKTEYEISQKQIEVEKTNAELQLSQKKRENQQFIGGGLLLGLLLLSSLAIVLLRNSRREIEVNNLLRKQKGELQEQRDLLKEVNMSKDRFFSIISHDLREPLGVLNFTTMLIREILDTKNYERLDELTSNMEYTVKNVQGLLDNLLEWALSQRGQYNYVAEKVELNNVILDTIGIFMDMAEAKGIDLCFEQKYANVYMFIDRNSLSTILRNLISNALKFTPKSGAVDVLLEKIGDEIVISVNDTGVGIPEEKIKTLFSIEAKKSTRGTAKEKGLGVGLNLVYEFVKLNKADIRVESTECEGTTFIVNFLDNKEVTADAPAPV